MLLAISVTLVFVLLNGFFVAAEFAIVKVRSSQIELMAKSGNAAAKLSKNIIAKLNAYLSATQLGITLASLGLGYIGEKMLDQVLHETLHGFHFNITESTLLGISFGITFALITILHIVFGELVPKSLAIQKSESVTLAVAYPLQAFYIVFKPLIWLMNELANLILKTVGIQPAEGHEVHSPEELKLLVEQGKESGSIETTNYEIIRNAFDFSDRTAKQIMIPRTQIIALNVNTADETAIDKLVEEQYSRMPVYEGSLDNIIGIVYVKDILAAIRKKKVFDIQSIMRKPSFVYQNQKIPKLLRQLQHDKVQMAVVIDEYGGTQGIITMEDIIEELVGEIQDEYDNELPIVEKSEEGIFKVLASAPITDLNEYLPRPLTERREYDTLAGLLAFELDRIPELNEKIRFEEYEFTVLKRTRSRLVQVQIEDLLKENQPDNQ
jgi:CBS domain containing-hemolysin-like protein